MTAPDRRLVYLISAGQRRLQRWIQSRTGESMTAAQSGLLFFLEKNDDALMREAGAALDLGPSAMSGLVDRTSDAGLIERRADAKDGRVWQLWITPAGREALTVTRNGLVELNARLTEGFTDAEIDVIIHWLASLRTKFPNGGEQRVNTSKAIMPMVC